MSAPRTILGLQRLSEFFPLRHLVLQFGSGCCQFLGEALGFFCADESLQGCFVFRGGVFEMIDGCFQLADAIFELLTLDGIQAFAR